MKEKTLLWAVRVVFVLTMASATVSLAQDTRPEHLRGIINDYAPKTGGTTAWELHGPWGVTLNEEAGTANFSASLTMGLSVLDQSPTNVQAVSLSQHTHYITIKDATVTYNPTDCPDALAGTPAYTARIEINGTASVFANGSVAPFGQYSPLQVCIAGGTGAPNVQFSNITLVFQNPAAKHFGPQPIHGLVRKEHRLRD
jgi:hypothetical protein